MSSKCNYHSESSESSDDYSDSDCSDSANAVDCRDDSEENSSKEGDEEDAKRFPAHRSGVSHRNGDRKRIANGKGGMRGRKQSYGKKRSCKTKQETSSFVEKVRTSGMDELVADKRANDMDYNYDMPDGIVHRSIWLEEEDKLPHLVDLLTATQASMYLYLCVGVSE